MAEQGTFLGEVQRAGQRFWGLKWWIKWPILAFVGLVVLGAALPGGDDGNSAAEASDDKSDQTDPSPKATETPRPTVTPQPPTATPTPIPPTATATPPPQPITLSGTGQTATEEFSLAAGVWVATFSHSGQRNFIVKSYDTKGEEDLLVNEIGVWSGQVAVPGNNKYRLDVQAGGAWTVTFAPIGISDSPSLSGTGSVVGGLFKASGGPKTYAFSHNGRSNFIVHLACDKGSDLLVQNTIGAVSGTRIVSFPSGATNCFWRVDADGEFSVALQ